MTFEQWLSVLRPHMPNVSAVNCRPTSPVDDGYNCIAWAADSTDRWWWPDPQEQSYWPPDVPRVVSLDCFIQAYGLLGYTQRTGTDLEGDKQKIAIFTDPQGRPTHASRQCPDGWWTSKLGREIDVEHELLAVEGPTYGVVAVVLARTRT